MIKIINNADDYGYSRAVNMGIIDSYTQGILTSTTLMAGMEGFDHAVELAHKNPGLSIGVHLTLTCGKPVSDDCLSLIDENGYFKKLSFYKQCETTVKDDEVYREWKAQIDKVIKAGIEPTHLDSHHHIHTFKNNSEVIKKLAKEYQLPVRNSFKDSNELRKEGIFCNDVLIDPWEKMNFNLEDNLEDNLIESVINQIKKAVVSHQIIEVMWHPAYLDKALMEGSGFAHPRIYEVEVLKSKKLAEFMSNEGIVLCNYKKLERE